MIKFIRKDGRLISQEQFPGTMDFSALELYRTRKNANVNPLKPSETRRYSGYLVTSEGK